MSLTTPRASVSIARYTALAACACAAAVLAVLLISGGSPYTLHAYFTDAGGLVTGDSVERGGLSVGSVTRIGVTPNGLADVTLTIDAGSGLTPLHRYTRADIRALGQAGLTNHYIALTPGPTSAPILPTGSVLPSTQTSGLVNYDEIIDSFGPVQRGDLQQLIAHSDDVYAGSGARFFNQMIGAFDPALVQLNRFTGQLVGDQTEIANVIETGAVAARAIASRSPDLIGAVAHTATTLGALAGQERALGDDFSRAPAVLDQARRTLSDAGPAITGLRPALADIPPAAGPLRTFLGRLAITLPAATPVAAQLQGQLPDLQATLKGLEPLAPVAVGGLNSAGRALKTVQPVVNVFRYYGSDLLIGVFQGLFAGSSANHDLDGHYARIEYTQPYQSLLGGPAPPVLQQPIVPDLFNLRIRQLRRCPGGNTPPAPDGSNPWALSSSICSASNDLPLSVDFP